MNDPYQITKLPEFHADTLEMVMAERLTASKNNTTNIPMLWQGLLEMDVKVGEETRIAKLYIPKDTPQGTAFVLLNVPEGKKTVSFLYESGWIDCADKYQLPVFAAEPGEDGWKSPAQEQAYINACVQTLFGGIYIRAGMSIYVVGYGSTGKCLHRYAMNTPLQVAAAVFMDASGLEDTVIAEVEESSLDGTGMTFDLPKKTFPMTFDIPKKDIPVPVWILERRLATQEKKAAAHWLYAIDGALSAKDPVLGRVYTQTRESVCTPDGPIALVCVKETETLRFAPAMTDAICRFLRRYARYNKFGPYGNSLVPYVDYETMGVEVRYFPHHKGDQRECLIYVPKAYRDGRKLPMVFAIHGSSESVRNYFEESLLYRKADKEGFILVMPETALYFMPDELSGGVPMAYRPRWAFCSTDQLEDLSCTENDLNYFDRIMTSVIEEYPVDESRIYGTGHSNGFMMTSLLASSPYGSRFAAIAMTSGVTTAWDDQGIEKVPVYMTMGEYDLWGYGLEEENGLTQGIDLWLIRNGLATEENAKQMRISGASETFTTDRHHCVQWDNAQGIPMVRYDWIEKKDHMNTADENNLFWDQWFSKWTLDKEKGRCYEGRQV